MEELVEEGFVKAIGKNHVNIVLATLQIWFIQYLFRFVELQH